MSTKDNLPAPKPEDTGDLVVFQPPGNFEVVDRGPAEQVTFAHHQDSFIGIYEGSEEATTEDGEVFEVALFTGADGKPYSIFPNWVLKRALRKVDYKQWARITYVGDMDTGKPSPMKCYIVEAGR